MAHSYVNLIYHIVFSTKDRQPLITTPYQVRLYEYVGGIIRQHGGIALAINGVEDHIHILARLRQDKALSDMIRDLKAGASGWIQEVFPELKDFAWQTGYGAFTVSTSQVEKVKSYIADQQRHHQQQTFREEFLTLLRLSGVEFDEQYLWK